MKYSKITGKLYQLILKQEIVFGETALHATQFVFQFMEPEKHAALEKSFKSIDLSSQGDSLMDCMKFHLYDHDLQFKNERDQNAGAIYQSFLTSLTKESPVVGTICYHGFKSANIYDIKTGKGKVLSRDIDLQERINFETYKHLQMVLRQLGINFHFVVLRDTYQALTLKINPSDKIYKGAPEIFQYGKNIRQISNETEIFTIDYYDLKNIQGESFEEFFKNNLQLIIENAKNIPNGKVSDLKGFLRKEYEYETCSNSQKDKRAMERATRYCATLDFRRKHEESFLYATFAERFGEGYITIPFSTHVEEYLPLCNKVPFRSVQRFLRSCNSQHQLPLLQQMTDGTYKMYTIRSDFMNKFVEQKPLEITRIDVGG